MRLTVFAVLVCSTWMQCDAYSVLSHEAIVDSAWESDIKPLLKARYPNATDNEIKQAHAYVYGGCLIQDMGYVPFVSRTFSDLTHYARSGDFVAALFKEASNLNEFAFAIGALAHYSSDRIGHKTINRITPMVYPNLKKKYGEVVTYEDNPSKHLQTEFALDVIQLAHGRYLSDAYHDFIGFEVAQEVLDRAFKDTYGLKVDDIVASEDMAIGTYRYGISTVFPKLTEVAWTIKGKELTKNSPGLSRTQFIYAMPRRKYEKEWGSKYHKPGIGTKVVAFMIRILPKVGPLKALGFHDVPPQGETMFLQAFVDTEKEYKLLLTQVKNRQFSFSDVDLDTGGATSPGEYKLADATYIKLVGKLADKHFDETPPELRANILEYFTQRDRLTLKPKTQKQLDDLRATTTASAPQLPEAAKPNPSGSGHSSTAAASR